MKTRCLIAAVLLSACGATFAGPGEVLVTFTIPTGTKFQKNLAPADKAQVESDIAMELARQLQGCFPPIDWKQSGSPDPAGATLIATLQEDGASPPNISIVWTARVANADLPLRTPPIELPVYGPLDFNRPLRNARQLTSDLRDRLSNWCAIDVNRTHLHDEFIKSVPLANRIALATDVKAVLIPLDWQRAKIDRDSVFRLEFMRTSPDHRMTVMLGGVGEQRDGATPHPTQANVIESCDADGAPVSDDPWTRCILLLQPNPPPLLVRFEKYVPDVIGPGVLPGGTTVTP